MMRYLLVVSLVEGECLLEPKQVLGAVAKGSSARCADIAVSNWVSAR
jgi:hypothetical protein